MSLIDSLQEMLLDQYFIYTNTILPKRNKGLLEAKELIDQAIDCYNPLRFENTDTQKKLEEAFVILENTKTNRKESFAAGVYKSFIYALATGLDRNRGQWATADELAARAVLSAIELVKIKKNGWSLFLKASNQALFAHIERGQYTLERTLLNYELCLNSYQECYDWIRHHFQAEKNKQEESALAKRVLHGFQRVRKELGDIFLNNSQDLKALDQYLAVSKLGESIRAQTFYKIMARSHPGACLYFIPLQDIDREDRAALMYSLDLAHWQAMLSLDLPDIEEVMEIFLTHFSRIMYWQTEGMQQSSIDAMFYVLKIFLDSDLFETIVQITEDKEMAKEPALLYKEMVERLNRLKESGEQDEEDYLNFLLQSPRKRELLGKYEHFLSQADNMQGKDIQKEKEYREKALLYTIALINLGPALAEAEQYRVYLFEGYQRLGDLYVRENNLAQAIDFYEEAAELSKKLDLEAFGYKPFEQAALCQDLERLYRQQGNEEKALFYHDLAQEYEKIQEQSDREKEN